MARPPNVYGRYIERRGQKFYAVLKVPEDVQQQLGRTRYIKALKTDSPAEARRRAPMMVAAWQTEIANARQDGTDPLAADAAWFRRALSNAATPAARRIIERDLEMEVRNIASPSYASYPGDPGPPEDVEEHFAEMAQDFHDRSTGKIVPTAEALDDWLAQWDVTAKSRDMARSDILKFAARFPETSDISQDAVQRYVDGLALAPASIQRSLSSLRTYWKYLQRAGLAPKDVQPFTGIELPKRRNGRQEDRKPFAPGDVTALCMAAAKKDHQLRDLILLGMWTGCRIEELCSLKTESIHLGGIPHLDIVDAKTAAGIRQVPIHPFLIRVLPKLLEASTDGYVLSGLGENKYGDRSNAIGKRFGRLKNDLGFGPQYVFHSIRKTVVTLLENAGVSENVTADIVGHEKPRITYGLYSGGASLAVKEEAINKLTYA